MATVELEVKDLKTGEVLSRYGDLSRSWTRNYYNIIVSEMCSVATNILGVTFGAGYLAPKDTSGTVANKGNVGAFGGEGSSNFVYGCESGVGNSWRGAASSAALGIVIGTSDTAESIDDYVLGAIVTEGTTTGKMSYLAMAAPTVTWVGTPTFKFKSVGSRVIVNNGGGSIGVKEIGIYGYLYNCGICCVVRDVLGATVTCPDPSQVTATYTLYSPALPS
jgi:hypothetical protein